MDLDSDVDKPAMALHRLPLGGGVIFPVCLRFHRIESVIGSVDTVLFLTVVLVYTYISLPVDRVPDVC